MFVGLLTPHGILIEANLPALAAARLKLEDVLGKPFEETYWWTHSLEIQQQLREAIARAVRGEASRYDVQIRAAENQLIDVDFSLQPLRDERGEVAFLVPSASVITERKQMENALRESNEKFHQLAGNITDAFWIRSPDMSEVHYVSPAFERIWGRSVASLHANPQEWTDFILPEDRARVVEAFAALRGDAPSLEIEYRIVRPNGEIRWIRVRGFQVRDAANKLIRHIGIVTDITESKLSEAALEKAHKELVETSRQAGMAEVATSVLHNVGNVLNSVNVASTCLADSLRKSKAANLSKVATMLREHEGDLGTFLTSDAKGKQIPGYLAQLAEHLSAEQAAALKELAQLQKNIEHIKDIVSMQQSFAKVSGATETLQVSDLVEDALRMNSSSFARHDIQVIKDFESMPSLAVEKHKVLQILVNLVRNAKHACDDSGRTEKQLTIRVCQQGEAARITISDNGIGIPSENLTRIFAHGFTTKKNGHGFGLHSSALAAKELGGSLSASSDGPDRGATFILELPLKHKAEGPLCAA
jgi:PAS domain S-box-containing protein